METKKFDFDQFEQEALLRLKGGEPLLGKEGVLTPLIKRIVEASLEGEMEAHLNERSTANRRNGKTRKKVKTGHGAVEIETPRDRQGTFEPEIVKKRQTTLGDGLDNKIISLYGLGMSYSHIQDYLEETYGLEVSAGKLSAITDKILPILGEWRNRSLDSIYPFVWMDAIHYKVREDGRVVTKAVYCVLGVNLEGEKELLGLYIGSAESSKFWLQVLTDLQTRGVEDILIASIDNLSGFVEAISSIYPQTEVQLCIVHQIRNSTRYVTSKDQKEFLKDLKGVYRAANKEIAETKLLELDEKWGAKYRPVVDSWTRNWDQLSAYFKYSKDIRRIVYTTNIIESVHRQFRKVTKSKGAFANDKAVMKLLYLVQEKISQKWTQPIHNWALTLSQLSIHFGERLRLKI